MLNPVKIGIFGSDKGRGAKRMISAAFRRLGFGHIVISVQSYAHIGDGVSFIIFQTSRLADIRDMKPDIIIFEHSDIRCGEMPFDGLCAVAVLETDDMRAAGMIADSGISAVTCGLSPKSSITASSMTDTETVISVQRSVIDIYGNAIEPQEIAFPGSAETGFEYEYLSAVSALLLSGIPVVRLMHL